MKETQANQILKALKNGEHVTPLEALNRWGCFCLASRISDLKKRGYNIVKKMIKGENGKRWGEYFLKRSNHEKE